MESIVFTSSLLSQSLAWALLYSLGQGLIIYAALFVLLKALPEISARAKYAISFSAFVSLFAWFIDTWVTQYQKFRGATIYVTTYTDGATLPETHLLHAVRKAPQSGLQAYIAGYEKYFPLLISIYTIGVGVMLCRFIININRVAVLKKSGTIPPTPHFADFIIEWQKRLGINRKVRLFFSEKVDVPAMVGFLRPVILLPIATINHLAIDQLEAILLHELVHIKRNDYLANILQTIGEALLFFNPFVWLISAIIRREREHCCDDRVVAYASDRLPYAKALAMLEYNRPGNEELALAATGNKNQLFHRIKRIMEMKKSNVNYSRATLVTVAVVALVLTTAMFMFTPSMAQKVKKDKSGSNQATTVTRADDKGTKKEVVRTHVLVDSTTSGGNNVDISITINDDEDGQPRKKVLRKSIVIDTGALNEVAASISIASDEVAEAISEAGRELAAVDWHKVKDEITEAMAEVERELDNGKLKREISLEVRDELAKARKEVERARKELRVEVDGSRAEAYAYSRGVEAHANSGKYNYEAMLNKMQKKGLIDREAGFKIVKKDGELFINGEKQPDEVLDTYRRYLNHKSVTIKGMKGNLKIKAED
jgi:beta-lactamase regulating signal transducer with metallopeptidase domain